MNSILHAPTRTGRILEALFLIHAALLPVSIAAGQVWAYLIAAVSIVACAAGGFRGADRSPLAPLILIFAAAVLLSVLVGVWPQRALQKSDRLLLMAVALVGPLIAGSSPRFASAGLLPRLLALFLIGSTGKALYDLVRIPIRYALAERAYAAAVVAGEAAESLRAPTVYQFGNMRDPQFYAAAICIAVALRMFNTPGFHRGALLFALSACGAAMLMHFKRGAWAALIATLLLMALANRRWRLLVGLLAVLAVSAQVPAVQARVAQVREEIQVKSGGRMALWRIVAPALYREYPLGMGWRSVVHRDLLDRGAPVQDKLNHLHNNLLHLRLETGWPGLASWLILMGGAGVLMLRAYRAAYRTSSNMRGPALGLLGAFVALHANGLVEYNFGDAEIFMLMNLVMGLGAAVWVHQQPPAAARRVESHPAAT